MLSAQLDTIQINSTALSRTIAVYAYDADDKQTDKPIIYLTDGKKMLDHQLLPALRKLTRENKIPATYYVFVSTIDEQTGEDHRNEYFFSNPDYLQFFEEELISKVEATFPKEFTPKSRSLIGISFGGLNAAYFSAQSSAFEHFGLLSPVLYPNPSILQKIAFSKNEQLSIFISSGKNDAEQYVKDLEGIYKGKSYYLEVLYTEGGHDFENWNSQLEAVLNFFISNK